VLVLGAIDRRVKAVVAQVPLISGSANIGELVRADFRAGFREQFEADRVARFTGNPPAMVRRHSRNATRPLAHLRDHLTTLPTRLAAAESK
jgi:hypothetical protein